ncbi:MAG: BlaI/MecI/CopY family transcriptional regulator, partial [Xanthomonadaceae bacterium]|nr:BlaI/MecI/CopY family transcriptional regulator [Xanthomonadaceae bacterium]
MPNPIPAISEAESRVMEALWRKAPQRSEDIVAAVQQANDWHEKTIRTLLGRLLGKGAVSAEKDGRRYLYSPTL